MKVIVRCANNRVTKTEMEQIIESLFQENKELRVHVGHLRDELNLSQQQSEARRQVICERDKLIQEMDEQAQVNEDETKKLKAKIATVCAERDNFEASYKQVLQWWEAAQSKAVKAEAIADEYRIAAMESDFRVDECEKRIEYLENELKQAIGERDELNAELVKYESEHYQEEAEEWKMTADKLGERVQDLNAQLHDIQVDYNELSNSYDDIQKINRDYAQEIDRLRKVVTNLQTNRFTADEFIGMLVKNFMPSADK